VIHITRPEFGDEEIAAVERVLRSGMVVQGPEVAAFETEFASVVGGRTCVAVNSGTSALHLALLASGIGAGDEVVVPSFTFAATANAVRLCGAAPVFADIDLETFTLDPAATEAVVTARTAAIMPVHLFGHPARMAELKQIADRHGLLLVEDAAQAHGASLRNVATGALGDVAAFSFYATKNMTAGEGGMVVLRDQTHARTVRLLRNQGMEVQYHNEMVGYNMRMTDIAASIGRVQLRRLHEMNRSRQAHAAAYDAAFAGIASVVTTPRSLHDAVHAYHLYTVRVRRDAEIGPDGSTGRDALHTRLTELGVESKVFYPVPVHRLGPFRMELDLPQTERATEEVLSLPVGPHLSDQMVDQVIEAVLGAVAA
jgi:perosamine synthetase